MRLAHGLIFSFLIAILFVGFIACGGGGSGGDADPQFDYLRPEVTVAVSQAVSSPGDTVTITVTTDDDLGVVSTSLTVDGQPVALNGAGTAQYTQATAGICEAVASATDEYGNEGQTAVTFRFLDSPDGVVPTVSIDSPADYSTITSTVSITGSAMDAFLVRYDLEYSIAGEWNYRLFASGTSSLANTVLGTLDPTDLRDGVYDIRLTAEDAGGQTASATVTLLIDGDADPAVYMTNHNDLTLPGMIVAGAPLTVTRTHDSRLWTEGDFGLGWRWQARDIQLTESGAMYNGWSLYDTGNWLLTYAIDATWPHFATVNMGGGEAMKFNMGLSPNSWTPPGGVIQTSAVFSPAAGTVSLVPLDGEASSLLLLPASPGPTELYTFSFDYYDSDRYRFTDEDDIEYTVHQSQGVQSIMDTTAATINFGPTQAIHSSGDYIDLVRDADGRITQVSDQSGNTFTYDYDFYGCLVRVEDQDLNATVYRYGPGHELIEAIEE